MESRSKFSIIQTKQERCSTKQSFAPEPLSCFGHLSSFYQVQSSVFSVFTDEIFDGYNFSTKSAIHIWPSRNTIVGQPSNQTRTFSLLLNNGKSIGIYKSFSTAEVANENAQRH
jgi:hypothetical protein